MRRATIKRNPFPLMFLFLALTTGETNSNSLRAICLDANPAVGFASVRNDKSALQSGVGKQKIAPLLKCTASAPKIVADIQNYRYVPMPFEIFVSVTNEGSGQTDSVFARIVLPAGDLKFAGEDEPNRTVKKVLPSILIPGQWGNVSWRLTHPLSLTEKEYEVGVWLSTANADSVHCSVKVNIPAIQPPMLSAQCSMPASLSFDDSTGKYLPLDITVTCVNTGGCPAMNVGATLVLPQDAEFVDPFETQIKLFVPSTIDPYNQGDPIPAVVWKVRYTRLPRNDTTLFFEVRVTGDRPDGFPLDPDTVSCSTSVGGFRPLLGAECPEIPTELRWNADTSGLEPNPFLIKDWKVFPMNWQEVRFKSAELFIPMNSGVGIDSSTPKLRNIDTTLTKGDTLYFTWIVHVANWTERRLVQFNIVGIAADGNNVFCSHYVAMPALPTPPNLVSFCDAPEKLEYDTARGEYYPNPFTVRLKAYNSGQWPASNVWGLIHLPDHVEIVDTIQDPPLKMFSPSTFNEYSYVDTIPEVTWKVRYTVKSEQNAYPNFEFVTGGTGQKGEPLRPIYTWCSVYIPGIKPPYYGPLYECRLEMPDLIRATPDKTKLTPNPFTVTLKVWNTGLSSGLVKNLRLDFYGASGITLDPSTPPSREVEKILAPGDTLSYTWIFHLEGSGFTRYVWFQISGRDENGKTISCQRGLTILPLPIKLSCEVLPSNLFIAYDSVLQNYPQKNWVITDRLFSGGASLNNVKASLSHTDPSGLGLVEFDPAFLDNTNPKILPLMKGNDTLDFSWGFRLRNPNTSGKAQTITFTVSYSSDEILPFPLKYCQSFVTIDYDRTVGIDVSGRRLEYRLEQNYPNPFNPTTVIEYEIPEETHVTLNVYDVFGREAMVLIDQDQSPGRQAATLDARSLPSGVYFYKLKTARYTAIRNMTLLR